jgi:hypothetical protein
MRQIDAGNVQQKLNLVRDKINDLESIDYAEILKKKKKKKHPSLNLLIQKGINN